MKLSGFYSLAKEDALWESASHSSSLVPEATTGHLLLKVHTSWASVRFVFFDHLGGLEKYSVDSKIYTVTFVRSIQIYY